MRNVADKRLQWSTLGTGTCFAEAGKNVLKNDTRSVPTMVPELMGYRHHGIYTSVDPHINAYTCPVQLLGTEYWVHFPHSASNTHICVAQDGEEDPCGSKCIPSTGINLPHLAVSIYFCEDSDERS